MLQSDVSQLGVYYVYELIGHNELNVIKEKVKVTLEQTTKGHRWSRVIHLLFL